MPKQATLVVAYKQGSGFRFARVNTSQRFNRELARVAENVEAKLESLSEREYAIGDSLEADEYMTLVFEDIADIAEPEEESIGRPRLATTHVPADPTAFHDAIVRTTTMEEYGGKQLKEQTRAISFYAIVAGSSTQDRIAYVRHFNPMRFAKSGMLILQLGDTLDKLSDGIFAMDERIDLVIRDDRFNVLDKGWFESMFFDLMRGSEELDGIVSETVSELPMESNTLEMIVSKTRDKKRARRKLLEIRRSGHLDEITLQDFKEAVSEKHNLPLKRFIKKDAKGNEVISVSEQDADLLLIILNDDLFKGALTGKYLAASGKADAPV